MNEDNDRQRLKRVIISYEKILEMMYEYFTEGHLVYQTKYEIHLPKDVEVVAVEKDIARNAFQFILRSSEFDIIDNFEEIPIIDYIYSGQVFKME